VVRCVYVTLCVRERVCVSPCLCLSINAVNGKRPELSAPKLARIESMAAASSANKSKSKGKRLCGKGHGRK